MSEKYTKYLRNSESKTKSKFQLNR